MTLLAMNPILALSLALGCAGGPDELSLGYGRILAGDSSISEPHGAWAIENDDSDIITVGLTWKLKPAQVEVVNPLPPPVRWTLEPAQEEVPETLPGGEVQDAEASLEELAQEAGEISDTLEAFDAFGTVTKVGFFLLAGWILFLYRHQLGRLIPGGKNGEKKN